MTIQLPTLLLLFLYPFHQIQYGIGEHSLRIEKDPKDTSRFINVFLPRQLSTSAQFHHFSAQVADISIVEESDMRDQNRTFWSSQEDPLTITINRLNPGHKYIVEILGRIYFKSKLIGTDQVLMDPVPPGIGESGIKFTNTKIMMRAEKPERALQDAFRIEYHQLDPLKRFPILNIPDIQQQHEVELTLVDLAPGRDYEISVTSVREELNSQPWKGVLTTRPLKPGNLTVTELNNRCVLFTWIFPPGSGADRFKIVYGLFHGPKSMLKLEVNYPTQKTELCQSILPGRVFIFAVIAQKSQQISEPATLYYTIQPLAPRELTVELDFEKARFRVQAILAPRNESYTEKCQFWLESEKKESIEQIVPAREEECEELFELVPGRHYKISAAALSGQTVSTRVLVNKTLEPAFNFTGFGLILREDDKGGVIRLEWPRSEVARRRVVDLWTHIVGHDSHLQFIVQPLVDGVLEQQRQVETAPTDESGPVLEDLKTINGWVNGHYGPFAVAKLNTETNCFTGKNVRQLNSDFGTKICLQKFFNCTKGLILCYPSKLGTIKGLTNLSEINVVTNRTAQLQLEHVPRDLYQICNRKDLWPTWSRWKKHGIRLSSDGKTVTIETSYALGNSTVKLDHLSNCAVFNFNLNLTEHDGTWNYDQSHQHKSRKVFDNNSWRTLRSGLPLRYWDPLAALPYDILTGLGPEQEMFAVWQHQNQATDGGCQMRITFHPDCSTRCVDAANWKETHRS